MAKNKANKEEKPLIRNRKAEHDLSLQIALDVLGRGYNSETAKAAVLEYRKKEKLSTKEVLLESIIQKANKFLVEEFPKDRDNTLAIDIERYNNTIVNILEIPDYFEREYEIEKEIRGNPRNKGLSQDEILCAVEQALGEEFGKVYDSAEKEKIRNHLRSQYFTALATIQAKEKLLHMHNKGFHIEIVKKLNVEKTPEEEKEIDFSMLTIDQKRDLIELLEACRVTDDETLTPGVILRKEKGEKIVDIPYEEVHEEINVEKIQHEKKPKATPADHASDLIDVNSKLAEAFRKKAEEEYARVRSKK